MNAEAPVFVPSGTKVCKFFLRDRCRYGGACAFAHPAETNRATNVAPFLSNILDATEQHRLKTATVTFGDGVEVLSIKLPPNNPPGEEQALDTTTTGLSTRPNPRGHVCTLRCTWFNPSRIVWLHYRSATWAANACQRFVAKVHGRHIDTKIIPPPDHHGQPNSIWSVQLRNVSIETTEQDLRGLLGGVNPDKIVLGASTSSKTREETTSAVRELLAGSGRNILSFDPEPTRTGSKTRFYVRFASPEHVKSALSIPEKDYLPTVGTKIIFDPVVSIVVPVLRKIHLVTGHKIEELKASKQESARIAVSHDAPTKMFVRIRVSGSTAKDVIKVSNMVQRLISGTVVLNNDALSALWDDFFATDEGLATFQRLARPGQLFVYRDLRKKQVVLHGLETLFEETRRSIIDTLLARNTTHTIPLEAHQFEHALKGGFRRLQRDFGERKVTFDVRNRSITVIGDEQAFQKANDLLLSAPSTTALGGIAGPDCPCCTGEAEDPVWLRCGHAYCRDCFGDLCFASDKFPLTCVGDDCKTKVQLEELRSILPHARFEALLEYSFETFVRRQPDRFSYCPTADCSTVFALSPDAAAAPAVFTCSNCLVSLCTRCALGLHDGLTCEEARHLQYEESEDFLKTQQFMATHGIKNCPRCRTSLDKFTGCHHVICQGCNAHLCWLCLAVFQDDQACYAHLQQVHGRLGDIAVGFEEDQWW